MIDPLSLLIGFIIGMFLYPRIMRWAYKNNYLSALPEMVKSHVPQPKDPVRLPENP